MSKPMMRHGLRHTFPGMGDAAFFAMIDETGGWPVGAKFVGFEHTDERAAGFCDEARNTGWWTVVASADDYYLWKLSPAALQRVADAVRDAMRIPGVDAKKLLVTNFQGYRAALSSVGPVRSSA